MAKDKQHQLEIVTKPQFIDGSALKIPMLQILAEDGTIRKGAEQPEMDKELALKIFDTMQFIRILDERMIAAQRQGRISFYLSSLDRKSTRLNSSHVRISYAVFCLKKKSKQHLIE